MWKDKYPIILDFFKKRSSYFKISGNELIIHCPYCDDGLRKNANHHGHLYISLNNPVFHCFRCEMSGGLNLLLKDLDFYDINIINDLKLKNNFNIIKTNNIFDTINSQRIDFYSKNLNYKLGNIAEYEKFEKYIYKRLIKYVDYSFFRITPEKINNNLCVSFYNYNNKFTTARIINPMNNYRYIKSKNNNELYFFQKMDFDTYENVVIAEGPFDIISLYLFSFFDSKKTFFISMLGKNYIKTIDWLILNHLLIGKFNINLIFDNDNKYMNHILKISKKVVNRLNYKISVRGYAPVLSNDVNEIPVIKEL